MDTKSSDSCEESTEEESERNDGFRIIDISILASMFECLRCPECQTKQCCFRGRPEDSKMGLASKLILKCSSRKCLFFFCKSFFTSGKVENGQAFEVNRREVLATRNIGVGHQGLVKFTFVMNMLPPMNENSYRDHVKAVPTAAESVALESMSKAATEVKEFYKEKKDGLYNIGVSGDGTWRKRGYSFFLWSGDSDINSHW